MRILSASLLSGSLLLASTPEAEISEARHELEIVAETLNFSQHAAALVDDCLTKPLERTAAPTANCDSDVVVETATASKELLEKIEHNLPDAIIIGLGSYFALSAYSHYRKNKNKGK